MLSFRQFLSELSKPDAVGHLRTHVATVTKIDSRNGGWTTGVARILKPYGFHRVGSGKYGSVFVNPDYPYALKIFMKDSAYLRWIVFAKKNSSNPYVPQVRGKVVKITPVIYAIRIEKLSPVKHSAVNEFMAAYSAWKRNGVAPRDPALAAVFEDFKKNEKLLDIHGENLMMRGNQLVVIDPYYNFYNKHVANDYTISPDDVDSSLF